VIARKLLALAPATAASLVLLSVAACGGTTSAKSLTAPSSAGPATTATPRYDLTTPPEIVREAFEAMLDLRTVRIATRTSQDSSVLTVNSSGAGPCSGAVAFPGATAEFISTSAATYLRGPDQFWRLYGTAGDAKLMRHLDGRWGKLPVLSQFRNACDFRTFLDSTNLEHQPLARLYVDSQHRFADQEVVEISTGEPPRKTSILVSTSPPHYILGLVDVEPTGTSTSDFSKINALLKIAVPPDSDTVDLIGRAQLAP
jgi:hypothetical protein